MENKDQFNQEEEEVKNIGQFQLGRSNGSAADGHAPAESDEYTEQETEFADGKGTLLDNKLGDSPEDQDVEEDAALDETAGDLTEDDEHEEETDETE